MYRIIVFDNNSTQETPIKPIEKVVPADKLVAYLNENLSDHTYCMVTSIEVL